MYYYNSLFNIFRIKIIFSFLISILDYDTAWKSSGITPEKKYIFIFFLIIIFLSYFVEKIIIKLNNKIVNKKLKNRSLIKWNKKIFIPFFILLIISFFTRSNFKAGTIFLSPFSIFYNLVSLEIGVIIIYFYARKKYKKLTFFSLIIYSLIQLLQGWTAFILVLFTYEIMLYFEKKRYRNIKIALTYSLSMLLGGVVYKYIFPLKFYIRLGVFREISYIKALSHLFSRVYGITTGYLAIDQSTGIANQISKIEVNYIKAFFLEWIPRNLWKNKPIFFNIGNELEKYRLGYETVSNSNAGVIGVTLIYLKENYLNGIIYIFLIILLIILYIKLLNYFLPLKISLLILGIYVIRIIEIGKLGGISSLISTIITLLLFKSITNFNERGNR